MSSIEISGWSCPSRDLEKIVKAVLQPENIGAKRLAEVSAGDPVIVFLPEGTESYACSHGMILYYKLQLLGNDKEVYVSMHRTEDGIVTWTSAYFYRDTLKPYSLILQPISVEPIPPDTCLHKFPSPAVKAGLAVASILITVLAAINASKFSREAQY
ncbi:MAG: hypothetical protein F7C35_01315 [Desulfurococcales archaeon]|nr:hypothetical protein [Desulfurococcales archaeon]